MTGANIVKIAPVGMNHTRSLATNGFLTLTTLNPANGAYGPESGPAAQTLVERRGLFNGGNFHLSKMTA